MQQPTRLISTPFAQEGDKTEIQNITGEFDNSATYRLGFPPLTMQSIRLGGKPPKGTDFNGVLFDITENISFLCKGGRYQYNAGLSTLIGGYPEGSNLLLDDNVTEVVSTVAGNQNNPNTDMTGWILKPNRTTAEYVLDASGETQQQVNYNGGAKWHSRVGGYLENERVVLANGDIVKSTVAGNTNDPNVNMTGWVKTNDASQIYDGIHSQKQINDNNRVNNVKQFGAVGTTALVSDWYTLGSANYRGYATLAAVKVDYPFINDGTESIDYAAFQATVNFAISNESNRIFIPFDNSEKYFINRTVNIATSGFLIDGNHSPSYQIRERGGYIYAPASVSDIFDYGVGGVLPSNQLIVNGVGAVGVATPYQSQNFIKHYNNNNGPHRGVLFTRTTAVRFQHVLYIKSDVPSYVSAGTVIFETGCVFTHNKNTVYAENRVFGFAMNSIQSEQGARVAGKFDGGVSFRDNMLEGQSNPITIDSNQPSLIVENNYFEAISGDYITAFRGTNINALFDERPNFISTVYSTDIHRINGIARLHAPYRYNLRTDRHSLYSFIGANLALGSEFDGAGYIGTGSISTDGLYGFCNPAKLLPARSTALSQKFLGSDVINTPFGKTYSGLKVTGTSAYTTVTKSWGVGDAVTAVALVKLKEGQAPNFSFYNSDGSLFAQVSQNTVSKMNQGWHVVVISGAAEKASTNGRWRFTSATEIEVAAVGVDVTPVADFKTFNSVQRAEIQVFNPLPLNAETQTYRDVRTLTIPAIATGLDYKTTGISVFGVAVGDAVVCTPNVDMQGLDWFARVSAANTVELRVVNRTAASVTLGPVQWNTRVFK